MKISDCKTQRTAVAKHQETMIVREHEDQQQYQTKQIQLPVHPSRPTASTEM